jgi:Signal transduction histidine kinase
MFKKLHLQLTFFSTLVTSLILIPLTLVILFISENANHTNYYASFLSETASIHAYLETQNNISYDWIARTQNNHKLILDIRSNEKTFLFSELDNPKLRSLLTTQANVIALHEFAFDERSISVLTQKVDFTMKGDDGKNYYTSVAIIPKNDNLLHVIILFPLDQLYAQLNTQRFLVLGLDLIGILFLFSFSWFFTKRMIKPIITSQEKQIQFVASASHELRSPLAIILSCISALKKAEPKDAKRFTHAIETEGARMSRLLGDMLSLASADSNKWSLTLEILDLDTLVLNMYEKYEAIAAEHHLSFHLQSPNQDVLAIYCDRLRIEQVLSILLNNAISYTPVGGKLSLELVPAGKKVQIRIIDNGSGVPDEDKESIFERFYRVDKNHSRKDHFGLGLCIAKEIILLHNGTITVQDTIGGGSTFTVTLPLYNL